LTGSIPPLIPITGHGGGGHGPLRGLAGSARWVGGGADAILIPEIGYDEKRVAEVVRHRHGLGKKSSIIVVAEGAHPARARSCGPIGGKLAGENSPGGVGKQLADSLEKLTGIETRSVVLGHIVRGGTPTSFDRILATRFGVKAMELVLKGQFAAWWPFKRVRWLPFPSRKSAEDPRRSRESRTGTGR